MHISELYGGRRIRSVGRGADNSKGFSPATKRSASYCAWSTSTDAQQSRREYQSLFMCIIKLASLKRSTALYQILPQIWLGSNMIQVKKFNVQSADNRSNPPQIRHATLRFQIAGCEVKITQVMCYKGIKKRWSDSGTGTVQLVHTGCTLNSAMRTKFFFWHTI